MIELLLEPEVAWAIVGGVVGAIAASRWPRNRWVALIVFIALGVAIGFVFGAIIDPPPRGTILETP